MHLTAGETALISSAVAALAIAASWRTTAASLRRQEKRAHDEWVRDQRAEAYLEVLRHAELERARLLRVDGAPAPGDLVGTFDQSVDLAARVNAFGSPEIIRLYNRFSAQMDLFGMGQYTIVHEGGAVTPAVPQEVETARTALVKGIRADLQQPPAAKRRFGRPSLRRRPDNPS